MRLIKTTAIILLTLFLIQPNHSGAADEEDQGPVELKISKPQDQGSDIDPKSYDGSLADRSLIGTFKGLYDSALIGRYLDPEPARQSAKYYRSKGLTAFVLEKKVSESGFFSSKPVGIFYVVMVGLFGDPKEADALGQRLRAQGEIKDYRILPVDDPGELETTNAQNLDLYNKSAKTSDQAREKASRPLSPTSPVETGQAFKQHVYGRYIGSYRDPNEARSEAARMTAGGWPASVERDGAWYRVYLAPTEDHRDFKADEKTLASARRSASVQTGVVILADLSSLRGRADVVGPNAGRTDASGCAGFSEAGRLGALLSRTINYFPESSYTVALTAIRPKETSWRDTPKKIKAWWEDEKTRTPTKALYGPAIFNRPEMERAILNMNPSQDQASLAMGMTEAANELFGIPGRKVLMVFSEFMTPDSPGDVEDALGRLKSEFGSSLEVMFIYGDANGSGYNLANILARQAGAKEAWDGCLLLNDNAYFEKYIKNIFR